MPLYTVNQPMSFGDQEGATATAIYNLLTDGHLEVRDAQGVAIELKIPVVGLSREHFAKHAVTVSRGVPVVDFKFYTTDIYKKFRFSLADMGTVCLSFLSGEPSVLEYTLTVAHKTSNGITSRAAPVKDWIRYLVGTYKSLSPSRLVGPKKEFVETNQDSAISETVAWLEHPVPGGEWFNKFYQGRIMSSKEFCNMLQSIDVICMVLSGTLTPISLTKSASFLVNIDISKPVQDNRIGKVVAAYNNFMAKTEPFTPLIASRQDFPQPSATATTSFGLFPDVSRIPDFTNFTTVKYDPSFLWPAHPGVTCNVKYAIACAELLSSVQYVQNPLFPDVSQIIPMTSAQASRAMGMYAASCVPNSDADTKLRQLIVRSALSGDKNELCSAIALSRLILLCATRGVIECTLYGALPGPFYMHTSQAGIADKVAMAGASHLHPCPSKVTFSALTASDLEALELLIYSDIRKADRAYSFFDPAAVPDPTTPASPVSVLLPIDLDAQNKANPMGRSYKEFPLEQVKKLHDFAQSYLKRATSDTLPFDVIVFPSLESCGKLVDDGKTVTFPFIRQVSTVACSMGAISTDTLAKTQQDLRKWFHQDG